MRGRNRINRTILGILTAVSMLFSVCAAAYPVYAETTDAASTAAESKAASVSEDQALTNLVDGWPAMRDINEQSGYIIDADNMGVLYSKNSRATRYPASTTKIMTALLTIENCALTDKITMTSTGTEVAVSGSTNAGTVNGEEFTIEEALSMLLLKSANDIANQLAEHIAGSLPAFADMMNARAKEIGCEETHFNNPSGLPDSEHYTTPHDMALIMRECIKNETFVRIAGMESCTIPPTNMTSSERVYTNHNKLLVKDSEYYYEYCIGGKTGYTDAAWRTYVAAAKKDGRTLVCVLMRGPDKTDFEDARDLFEYGFNNFRKIEVDGGSVNLPEGIGEEYLSSETEEGADGKLHTTYFYNQLEVGTAVTDKPVPTSQVSSAADSAESAAEPPRSSAKTNVKKSDARALIITLLVVGIVFAATYAYKKRLDQIRREKRRRKRDER